MGQRPAHLKAPAHLSPSPPVPEPAQVPFDMTKTPPLGEKEGRPEPTRYGDWEQKGIAVDF